MRSHGIYTQRGLRVSGDRCALLVLSRTQVLLHERTPLRFVLLPCSESCACANANPGFVCRLFALVVRRPKRTQDVREAIYGHLV